MPTVETIRAALASGDLTGLQGFKEDQCFDAKQPPGYDLTTEVGRFELAKDVSSFANAEGGYIIIGLTTEPVAEEQTERVNGFAFIADAAFNRVAIEGVLREYLYPRLQGLDVRWVADAATPGQGVGVIFIPQMEHDKRFILMKKVIDTDSRSRHIVFGIAVRRGSNSLPFGIDQLHQMCQDGRST